MQRPRRPSCKPRQSFISRHSSLLTKRPKATDRGKEQKFEIILLIASHDDEVIDIYNYSYAQEKKWYGEMTEYRFKVPASTFDFLGWPPS